MPEPPVANSRAGGSNSEYRPSESPDEARAGWGAGRRFGIALDSASTRTLTVWDSGRPAGSYRCPYAAFCDCRRMGPK